VALPPPAPPSAPDPLSPYRYRLTYAKLEEGRWLGHLEMVASLYRRPAPLQVAPVVLVRISSPARVSFYDALPLGVESLAETMGRGFGGARARRHTGIHPEPGAAAGPEDPLAARLTKRLGPPGQKGALYQVESLEPVF